jgi:hypothetical protein
MPLYDDIRQLVHDLYDQKIDVRSFRESFILLFAKSSSSDQNTESLATAVEGTYAEFIDGAINESQLRNRLFQLVPSIRLEVNVIESKFSFYFVESTENTPVIPVNSSLRQSGSLQENRGPKDLLPA